MPAEPVDASPNDDREMDLIGTRISECYGSRIDGGMNFDPTIIIAIISAIIQMIVQCKQNKEEVDGSKLKVLAKKASFATRVRLNRALLTCFRESKIRNYDLSAASAAVFDVGLSESSQTLQALVNEASE